MSVERKAQPSNATLADQLRLLPSVDLLLQSDDLQLLQEQYTHELVVDSVRLELDRWRERIKKGEAVPDHARLVANVEQRLHDKLRPSLRQVINGTGVIIHTNLGRAPIGPEAIVALGAIGGSYSNLEFSLESGERGSRTSHVEDLLRQLTGCEAALIVNNNAAAVLLMLTALCRGKEVVISRGQLVEIGGGFRIPDVMAQSGATLVEVGTTNRTHLRDYEKAINEETGALLVAHHSNFKLVGFTSEPTLGEMARLATSRHLPLLFDQGSGALRSTKAFGLEPEVTVQEALSAGVSVVAFSGDKLLGGPQAGILCGSSELIDMMRRHPLARALRADKLALASLSETIKSFLLGRELAEVPVWQMISRSVDSLERRVRDWAIKLEDLGQAVTVVAGESAIGGGSFPGATLPTWLLGLRHRSPVQLAKKLRRRDPAIIGRISNDLLLFDARTIDPHQDDVFLEGIRSSLEGKIEENQTR